MAQAITYDRKTALRFGTAFVATTILLAVMGATDAHAQDPSQVDYYDHPYGSDPGIYNQPFDANTRDANGNRVIVDGRYVSDSSFSQTSGVGGSSVTGDWGGSGGGSWGLNLVSTAIGNSLNVVTVGNNNTVIVDSTQINNGNQEADIVLNGDINFD